jgi:hypothetical protein
MGAGEGSDNFGQCAEMKMNHAADGMMMVEEIAVGGQRPEASRTLERLEAGMETPATASVTPDDRSLCA